MRSPSKGNQYQIILSKPCLTKILILQNETSQRKRTLSETRRRKQYMEFTRYMTPDTSHAWQSTFW